MQRLQRLQYDRMQEQQVNTDLTMRVQELNSRVAEQERQLEDERAVSGIVECIIIALRVDLLVTRRLKTASRINAQETQTDALQQSLSAMRQQLEEAQVEHVAMAKAVKTFSQRVEAGEASYKVIAAQVNIIEYWYWRSRSLFRLS